MPKISKPLNDRQIQSAKPRDKDYSLPDGGGLGLLVTSQGSKLWRLRVRINGKQAVFSFGTYPYVSLADARKKRLEVKSAIAKGIDPRETKTEKTGCSRTFEQLAIRLYKSKAGRTTDVYRKTMLRQLEIHMFPAIGKKNITDIHGKELYDLFTGVSTTVRRLNKPMTGTAKKLCSWTAEVFDFANMENTSFNLPNPCRSIVKFLAKHETEHMRQIPFNQLPEFIKALQAYNGNELTKTAIWMMLYTGVRQASIYRAQWSDFDMNAGVWNRKPEKKDKEIHEMPLPKQAVHLLEQVHAITGSNPDGLVFNSIHYTAIGHAIKDMGFDANGHGIRGTVTTGLNELGHDFRKIEVQTGHAIKNTVEAAYNHSKLFEARRMMMQEWADYLDMLKA